MPPVVSASGSRRSAGPITFDDLTSPGVEARVTALSASLTPSTERVEFNGTASLDDGAPVAFSGRVGSPTALFGNGGGAFPVRLTVAPDKARLSVEGQMARPLEFAGIDLRMEAQGEDLAPLLAAFAGPATHTPPFGMTARLTDIEHGWSLRDVAAQIGRSELRGEGALRLPAQERPQLSATLLATQLAPADFHWLAVLGGGQDGSSALADARLPTAWLKRADAQGSLRVERLEGLASGPVALRLEFKLDDGRLHIEPLRLDPAQGMIGGSATVDAAGPAPPLLVLRAEANDLRLESLLAMLGTHQLTGRVATAFVDLRGQGTTLREVAAGLDGALRFQVSEGSIGLGSLSHMSMGLVEALGVALGGQGGGSGSTPLTCAIGDLQLRQGVGRIERLVLVTPQLVIVGEGEVRLANATVHLALTPRPLDEALFRVVVPVVVSGTLTSPEVTKNPDLRVGSQSADVPDPCGRDADRR